MVRKLADLDPEAHGNSYKVVQSLIHCDPMDCHTLCFPVLLELAQTRVHWVGDAIQPSRPLLLWDLVNSGDFHPVTLV